MNYSMSKTIKIFCDGSCSVHDPKLTGAHCAVVDVPGERKKWVYGSCNETTISKMEIRAVAAGMVYLLERFQKGTLPRDIDAIEVYCDSQYVVGCANGDSRVSANKPQWAEFFEALGLLKKLVSDVIINKIPRNTEPESEAADRFAGELRELVASFP